jgi:hypothetical protein
LVQLVVQAVAPAPSDKPTLPAPVIVTARLCAVTSARLKVAVTRLFDSTVTTQPPVPLQAPPQPLKLYPAAGVAARLMTLPLSSRQSHRSVHAEADDGELTLPLPDTSSESTPSLDIGLTSAALAIAGRWAAVPGPSTTPPD